jgi:hypothetical protein
MSMSSFPLVESDLLVRQSCISEHEDVESQIELEVGLVRIKYDSFRGGLMGFNKGDR